MVRHLNDDSIKAGLLLLLVLVLGLAIAAYMYSGPNPFYDDTTYIYLSSWAIAGNSNLFLNEFAFGFLAILQISAFFYAFGYGNLQAVASSVLDYIIMIYLIFLCGRRIGGSRGNWFGFISAYIAATVPFVSAYVFRTMIDIPIGMLASLSVYVFLRTMDGTHRRIFPVLFGLSVSSTIFIKLEGYLVLLATTSSLLIMFILDGAPKKIRAHNKIAKRLVDEKYVLYFITGVFIALAIELLVFEVSTGNPFFMFENYLDIPNSYFGYGALHNVLIMFAPYALSSVALSNNQVLGPFIDLSILGGLIAIIKRDKVMTYLFLVDIIGILYFIFGPNSLILGPNSLTFLFNNGQVYSSIYILGRYLTILIPFISLLGAYFLFAIFEFINSRVGHGIGRVVVIAILLGAIYLEIPIFAHAYSHNLIIRQQNVIFGNVMRFISNASNGSRISVYTNYGIEENSGYGEYLPEALQYYSKFNRNYTFKTINMPILPSNNSPVCNASDSGAFMVDFYVPAPKGQNVAAINTWLDGNCTITYLKTFSANSLSSTTTIKVYRVKSVSG